MADIREAIRVQISEEFLDGRRTELTDETRLVEEEIIDSLGIFLLLGFIKDRLGVEVAPEDVTLENFASVNAIASLVERRRSGHD
jgi:acyl carrier protein